MINLAPKAKTSKKAKKKAHKLSSRVPRRPEGYFVFTPEDIAEMNAFSVAAAKSTVAADERRQAGLKAKAKTKA
jgi:hypothetical protein